MKTVIGVVEVTVLVRFLKNKSLDELYDTSSELIDMQCEATAQETIKNKHYSYRYVELTASGFNHLVDKIKEWEKEEGRTVISQNLYIRTESFVKKKSGGNK